MAAQVSECCRPLPGVFGWHDDIRLPPGPMLERCVLIPMDDVIPSDAHLCRGCKLRPKEAASGLCATCVWVAVANEGWPDPRPIIIREMRNSGKGG